MPLFDSIAPLVLASEGSTSGGVLILFLWLVCVVLCGAVARSKNRSVVLWVLVGFISVGFIGLIVVAVLPKRRAVSEPGPATSVNGQQSEASPDSRAAIPLQAPAPATARGGVSDEEQEKLDLAEELTGLQQGVVNITSAEQSPVLLKRGERLLFVFGGISLEEPHSVTTGRYGGPSIHVVKGITIRLGAFRAQSHEELKVIDSGTLALTSKRLCFCGRLRTHEIDLRKLISVDAYSDGVAIRRSGKEKTEFYLGLDHATYSFTIQGRRHSEPMSGLILKYAIEGLLVGG
jgi:hypothetical protein